MARNCNFGWWTLEISTWIFIPTNYMGVFNGKTCPQTGQINETNFNAKQKNSTNN